MSGYIESSSTKSHMILAEILDFSVEVCLLWFTVAAGFLFTFVVASRGNCIAFLFKMYVQFGPFFHHFGP